MKIKRNLIIAMLASALMLFLSNAAASPSTSKVSISTFGNHSSIGGYLSYGRDWHNPNGYIDAQIISYSGGYSFIQVVGKNTNNKRFFCFMSSHDASYETMKSVITSMSDTSFITAAKNNGNKCSIITVTN